LNVEDNLVQVEIVEVNSEVYKPHSLVKKLKWYHQKEIMNSLVNHLPELKGSCLTETTPLVVRVFIQRRHRGWFREQLNGIDNVKINSLETVFESHLDWQKRTLASEE
jgi:hypothetical protein